MCLPMKNLCSVATLKKQKTGSTPTVKLDKLDINTATTVMVHPVKDVSFVEKLREQLQLLTKLQIKLSQQ